MRAMIRAKVELLRARRAAGADAAAARQHAVTYFALARAYLAPPPPRLIAIGGLSGSGKSAVARGLAPQVGPFPGAVHVRSDFERKFLFGVGAEDRLPARAYAPEVSEIVYGICRKRAELALEGGHAVIVDAVHAKQDEREALAALAARVGVPFTGLWLDATADILRERVAARLGDVSDATPEIVDAQLGYVIGKQSFAVVDARRPLEDVVAACLERVLAVGEAVS
jgi:predicted kinase